MNSSFGIEKFLSKDETPDGREGVILQFWSMYNESKSLKEQIKKFFNEVSIRIRQDILSASGGTTRIFNWFDKKKGNEIYVIDTKDKVGDCGGGYETVIREYGRECYKIPLMMGYDFKIDKEISIGIGISGANLWFMCKDLKTARIAGRKAIDAIKKIEGVVMPFYVCPSGSMVGNYREIGPPTNYRYCPTLKGKIQDLKLPEDVTSVPEIVINGLNLNLVKNAMKVAIKSVIPINGVKKISAGNYGGKLGKYKIYLKDD